MKRTIRLEIDLILDDDGVIQVDATSLRSLQDDSQAMCFLTGQPRVTCQCSECTRSSSNAKAANRPEQRKDIEVVFTHPRKPFTFTAMVSPECTGKWALEGLLLGDESGSFIKPAALGRPYELAVKQSGIAITPNMTFAEAGVLNGEIIEVRQASQGGGAPWDAIQLSLAYGVGTGVGLAFVKALAPILTQNCEESRLTLCRD